jgi:hypothetical protein
VDREGVELDGGEADRVVVELDTGEVDRVGVDKEEEFILEKRFNSLIIWLSKSSSKKVNFLVEGVREVVVVDREGLDRVGLNREEVDRVGVDREEVDREGAVLDRMGLDREGMDRGTLDRERWLYRVVSESR